MFNMVRQGNPCRTISFQNSLKQNLRGKAITTSMRFQGRLTARKIKVENRRGEIEEKELHNTTLQLQRFYGIFLF